MSKNKKKTKQVRKKETLIYCGPSFTGELEQYSVFKGNLPVYVKEHIKKCPTVGKLFVSIKDFPEFKSNINVAGKKENQLFNKVLEYQKKEAK